MIKVKLNRAYLALFSFSKEGVSCNVRKADAHFPVCAVDPHLCNDTEIGVINLSLVLKDFVVA